jgi:hypothetical protein
MVYKTVVGALYLYERDDGTYLACKKTTSDGLSDVQKTRFVILGRWRRSRRQSGRLRRSSRRTSTDFDGGYLESLPRA